MPTSHIPADWDPTVTDAKLVDGDRSFHRMVDALYTIPFNYLNSMTVVNVPAGISSQDMPIGMQIIGKPNDTKAVFRVAYAFSKGGPRLHTGQLFPKVK